ncbi:hypothetical protein [Streptomyces tritici]|uniref:hypothetical protein n=1 Tax=Streptomyces tritici TaxID=2054410 RepID=UPI003AF17A17
MTAAEDRPRHLLLPDPERSRAVLVGSGAGLDRPAEVTEPTRRLAVEALTGAGSGTGAFHPENVTLLLDPERPEDVLAAVREAADAASDVLLFQFAGRSFLRGDRLFLGVRGTDPERPEDTGVGAAEIAGIMGAGRAARVVVALECSWPDAAASAWTEAAPRASVLAGPSSFEYTEDPFTGTLVHALLKGVQQGPQVLDLVALGNAMEAAYAETRYCVENEYIGAPSGVLLRGGADVALGVNPAFGAAKDVGALPPHPDVVDEWWRVD